MTTMKDIAKLAGVSTATVSRALMSPEKVSTNTLERIKKVLAEEGYSSQKIIQRQNQRTSNIITVILNEKYDASLSETIQGIIDTAKEHNYQVLFGYLTKQDNPPSLEQLLLYKHSDGLLLLTGELPFDCDEEANLPPTVMACEHSSNINIPTIHIDNLTAAFKAVGYLISVGHTRIAEMSSFEDSRAYQFRHQGYDLSLKRKGINISPDYLVKAEASFEGGAKALLELLGQEFPPTAIFCHNDLMAIGAIQQAKKLGIKVPEELSIIGFDDTPFAPYCDPPLTTMSQPRYEIGQQSMMTLLNLIQGKGKKMVSQLLESNIVMRNSVNSPKVLYKTNVVQNKLKSLM